MIATGPYIVTVLAIAAIAVTSILSMVRTHGKRLDRLDERVDHVVDLLADVRASLGRIEGRLGTVEEKVGVGPS